ncbi:NFACT family protein [Candidatus Nitronereus thalassa]|uniref:NFACT family protein n=1 Tax=Candidatus Nitronereus thalassa TaxID=3020898 RepID=A0ABU3K4S2_9BACT|nr:NFACT family protein [Candidatus Nitronereus thalassa]MDT7041348.1 NFACT family protein [Candidatus Nitronereus thalassa]
MAISLEHLSQVLSELKPALIKGKIQKISQPLPESISFEIRRPGQTVTLYISTHPQTARIHALTQRLPNPTTPPQFCQYLRSHILGAQIEHVVQVPDDRVVWFELSVKHVTQYLVIALTGRSANLFLVNHKHEVVRSLKPDSQSAQRIQNYFNTGQKQNREDPDTDSPSEASSRSFPISAMLEQTFHDLEQNQAQRQLQEQQLAALRKAMKKAQRRVNSLTQDLEKAQRYCEYGRYGELLKGQLGQIKRGQSHVTLIDYYDEHLPELTLPLDPTKDPTWNLNDYFRKYRKFTGAQRKVLPRLEQAQAELAKLTEDFQAAERGEMKPPEFPKPKPPTSPRASKTQKTALPYRRYISEDGFSILVGKSAKDNDAVTFKVSKQDDMWLHARGTPGSHVIIELEKKKQVPPETLKDAATLALFYSDLRKSGKGEVIYTLRNNVRKPKGAKPGSVTVTQEKTTWVYVDEARLKRLKDSVPSMITD